MASLLLALIGIPVGLVLDALAVHFASQPDEEDEAHEAAPSTAARSSEAGVLVIEDGAQAWLRRLLITGATVALFAAAGTRFDLPGDLAIVTAYVCVLLVCAGTDLMCYRVPNAVTYPAIVIALAVGATMSGASMVDVGIGGALAGGVFLLPALFTGGIGMGMGDVKLAAFVGLALGLEHVAPAMLITALGGGAVALFLLLTGLRKRGEPIPYAPFIAAGGLAALLWQGTAFVGAG
jgi:prepilin signal peptidase PulO-like enzyme (type II secretory pathway)